MEDNKRVTILIAIALILAVTAIALNVMDSNEVPTASPLSQGMPTGAVIGIDIGSPQVEDKLTAQ